MITELEPLETEASYTFTDEDRAILHSMEPLVDGLARLHGPHCEVLLHSLEDMSRSVVKIANGHITGREVGSPVTDLAIKVLQNAREAESDVVGGYFTKTMSGKTLKSVTILVRNFSGRRSAFSA
ncbi:MAG: hypothetical protein HC888_17405 [Candidatus Competibacteraceae bacterium]|nr:hypothetical protein [Candidatus Competibacteraceae bacterium]